MPELPQETIHYKFILPEFNKEIELDIPFTEAEMILVEQLRKLYGEIYEETRFIHSSNPLRDFFSGNRVPYCYVLRDRAEATSAFSAYRQGLQNILTMFAGHDLVQLAKEKMLRMIQLIGQLTGNG